MNDQKPEVNNNETKSGLAPVTIGQLAAEKSRKTGLIMIVTFILFFVCIYFLPDIYSKFENIDKNIILGTGNKTSTVVYQNNNENIYPLDTTSKIYIDSIGFFDFSIVNTTLKYKVINYNDNRISLKEMALYVSLYDEAEKLLGTFKITNNLIINSETVIDSLINISTIEVGKVKSLKISEEKDVDVAEVQLTKEGEFEVLTCSSYPNAYKYFFTNKKLVKVYHEINVYRDLAENFEMEIESYQNMKTWYNEATGYTENVILFVSSDSLKFSTTINLKGENIYELNENYLTADAEANYVNFEMETKGFDCK